jgi:hypothetical protein
VSRFADALRPAVERAARAAMVSIVKMEEGRHYPVQGVDAYFDVGLIEAGATTVASQSLADGDKIMVCVRAHCLLNDTEDSESVMMASGDPLPDELDALLVKAVRLGPERLAKAWEDNMFRLIEAGVSPEDLQIAVGEALARMVMEA